jgi:hypothetical protein
MGGFLMVLIAMTCNLLLRISERRGAILLVSPLIVPRPLLLIVDIDSPRGGVIHMVPQDLLQQFFAGQGGCKTFDLRPALVQGSQPEAKGSCGRLSSRASRAKWHRAGHRRPRSPPPVIFLQFQKFGRAEDSPKMNSRPEYFWLTWRVATEQTQRAPGVFARDRICQRALRRCSVKHRTLKQHYIRMAY